MRILIGLLVFVLLYLTYGLFISQFNLRVTRSELLARHPEGFYDYKGVVNIHTTLSTGSGSIEEVVQAAQAANLDFIFITDLNQFKEKPRKSEYHSNLLVFFDGEFSYLNSRLLNLDSSTLPQGKGAGSSQLFFEDLLSNTTRAKENGFFVLAHPFKPRYEWQGNYPPGLDGLEIINLKAMWEQAWLKERLSFFWTLFIYPFNERLALIRLFHDPIKEIKLWDQLLNSRHTIGLAGTDAESKIQLSKNGFIRFPSYESLFSLVSNHVLLSSELTGQTDSDHNKITEALKRGQFYMSLDILANPKGFMAKVISPSGQEFPIGSKIRLKPGMQIKVQLPHQPKVPFDTIIYRNGEKMMTSNSQETSYVIHAPGVYRVKVKVIPTFPLPDGKKWVPWIYTNPFYIE